MDYIIENNANWKMYALKNIQGVPFDVTNFSDTSPKI